MDPTIFISFPPSGTTVGSPVGAAGGVSPFDTAVTVKLWNANNTYGPFNATVQGGEWSYHFLNVAAGSGYSVKAWIAGNPNIYDQHNNITVQ
jgi:hypothetical protein